MSFMKSTSYHQTQYTHVKKVNLAHNRGYNQCICINYLNASINLGKLSIAHFEDSVALIYDNGYDNATGCPPLSESPQLAAKRSQVGRLNNGINQTPWLAWCAGF